MRYLLNEKLRFLGSSHHSENRLHLAGSGSGSESASDGRTSSVANRQQHHIVNRQHSNQALNRDGIGDLPFYLKKIQGDFF